MKQCVDERSFHSFHKSQDLIKYMYIVAIAWMYVTILMAVTEKSFTAGLLTFIFYGLFPCLLFIWLFSTPQRKRNKALKQAEAEDMKERSLDNSPQPILGQPNGTDTKPD